MGYPEYARYYEAQALFQGDIVAWEKWNKLLIRQLKQIQQRRRQLPGPVRQRRRHRPCRCWPWRSIIASCRSTSDSPDGGGSTRTAGIDSR